MRACYVMLLVLIAACGGSARKRPDRAATPVASADTSSARRDTSAVKTYSTTAIRAPKGHVVRTDDARPGDTVTYHLQGSRYDITTGAAHIMYAAGDTLRGSYIVASTFRQMQAPTNTEAFGLFVGGTNLETAADQRYTSFIVRGSGEYAVKVRDGIRTRDVAPWMAHAAVPRQDASGQGTYRLTIQVVGDSVRFLVNATRVTTLARSTVPTDGVFGLRVNNNLRLKADFVRRTGA